MAEQSPKQDRAPNSRRRVTTFIAVVVAVVGILGVTAAGITIAMEVSGYVDTGWSSMALVTKVVSPLLWVLIGVAMWRRRPIATRFVVIATVWWVLHALYQAYAVDGSVGRTGVEALGFHVFGLVPYAMLLWYLRTEKVRYEFDN